MERINIAIAAPPAFSRAQSPSPAANATANDSFPLFTSSDAFNLPINQHDSHVPTLSYFPSSRVDRFFEEGSDVPRPEIQAELFEVFFDRLGSHFPFLSRADLRELDGGDLASRVDAPMLINSVCAVAAR